MSLILAFVSEIVYTIVRCEMGYIKFWDILFLQGLFSFFLLYIHKATVCHELTKICVSYHHREAYLSTRLHPDFSPLTLIKTMLSFSVKKLLLSQKLTGYQRSLLHSSMSSLILTLMPGGFSHNCINTTHPISPLATIFAKWKLVTVLLNFGRVIRLCIDRMIGHWEDIM